jgi:hypothetical protein
MGRAEDLFYRLIERGEAAIDDFIHTRKSEELFLDFKRSADDASSGHLNPNDRNNLARAISGFANSEGGVVVWGIDCRRGSRGDDLAQAKRPLADCQAFVSWLEGAVSGCSVPPAAGVRSIPIPITKAHGFAATLVPRSTRAPHQDVLTGKYYIRAGSDFLPAPHGVLAGLFGQRPEPYLFHNLVVSTVEVTPAGGVHTRFVIHIVSDGPGIAKDLFLTMLLWRPGGPSHIEVEVQTGNMFESFQMGGGRHLTMYGRDSFKLPPGGRVSPLVLDLSLEPPFSDALSLEINYGCAGSATHQVKFRHDAQSLDQICAVVVASPQAERTDLLYRKIFGQPGTAPQRRPYVEER